MPFIGPYGRFPEACAVPLEPRASVGLSVLCYRVTLQKSIIDTSGKHHEQVVYITGINVELIYYVSTVKA